MSYLVAFLVPIIGFWSLSNEGLLSFSLLIYGFIGLSLIDAIIGKKTRKLIRQEQDRLSTQVFYKWFLRIMLPLHVLGLVYFFIQLDHSPDTLTTIGHILTYGIMCGVMGINVAHELGHKNNPVDLFFAKSLLLCCLYMHFHIEHNRGHHKNVGKPNEPGTAKLEESLYAFYVRAIIAVFTHAWKLEKDRLLKNNIEAWSLKNQMIRFMLIQLGFVALLAISVGWLYTLYFFFAAFIGILLLEAINYIEHYGLKRLEIKPDIYESVAPRHSWNSDHWFSRVSLFELPLHPDHHLNASKQYQTLNSRENAPQMPFGYPFMILMALFPPIWFKVMNSRIPAVNLES